MGWIAEMSVEMIRERIERSNQNAGAGRQRYLHGENRAIEEDYEFLECGCPAACSCRQRGCRGHYIIRDMGFEQFLSTYVRLWIPNTARSSIIHAVLHGSAFNGRPRNAIPPLRWLMEEWKSILSAGKGPQQVWTL
jgi:hypothetical protein